MEAASHERTSPDDAPTQQLVAAAIGDRCANCGSPLAPDQRYCVACGERRGKPRFPVPGSSAALPAAPPPPPGRVGGTGPRFTSSSTFVAGIGVLLLAMGVGVLIGALAAGNGNNQNSAAKAAPIVVHVNGSGPAANSGNTGTSGNSGSASSSHKGKHGKAAKNVTITKVVQQKAAAAATKVLGGSKKLAAPTVAVGGACTPGTAGCSASGKFTGAFFPTGNSGP